MSSATICRNGCDAGMAAFESGASLAAAGTANNDVAITTTVNSIVFVFCERKPAV